MVWSTEGSFFFFQAEDGIRDWSVTGVQTCALPISLVCRVLSEGSRMTQQRLRPLDGTTVVSLEHAVAAPFCTRQLADLGARVIKVERPGSGDFARGYDQRVQGQSSHFTWINRSKQSLALDLKQDEAMQALLQLLEGADVLVQNLAPGAAARMGLSYAALRERFPRLIVCDIS